MKRDKTAFILTIVGLVLLTVFGVLIHNGNMQLLNPQGYIAQRQSILLITALLIGLFLGIPVVALTIFVALRYRDHGDTEKEEKIYTPEWRAGKGLTAFWWSAPAVLVLFWAIIGWQAVHLLDPYKPLQTNTKPIEVQVVSLQWKWLFIYPSEHIATVNYLEFPVNTPVHFQLTSDAPYNAFWIPSLGSQIYTMTGMVTQLNLMANHIGLYPGEGTEMSGEGFSGMNFTAKAVTDSDYASWIQSVRATGKSLDRNGYNTLAQPSSYNAKASYLLADTSLFEQVLLKYMPAHTNYMTTMHL